MTSLPGVASGASFFARLAYRVGSLSSPKNRMFFAPDVKGAKIIAWVSLGFLILNFVLGQVGDYTKYLLWFICAAAAVLAFKNLQGRDQKQSLIAIAIVAVLVPLVVGLFQIINALGLPVLIALAGLYGFFYSGGRAFDGALRVLGQQLGDGWYAFTPMAPGAERHSRVILGPNKQAFLLGFTPGRLSNHYNEEYLEWDLKPATLEPYLHAELRKDLKPVIWVDKPSQATGHWEVKHEGATTTVFDNAPELARHLINWEEMLDNLKTTDTSNIGEIVKQQTITALKDALPDGWNLEPRLHLAAGGMADIILQSPLGRSYVIRIVTSRDTPSDNGRWNALHDELMLASRQLFSEPVIWQSTLRGTTGVFRSARYIQGSAGDLLGALDTAHDEARRGETGEVRQFVVSDTEQRALTRTGTVARIQPINSLEQPLTVATDENQADHTS